jgi:hypothetical protein
MLGPKLDRPTNADERDRMPAQEVPQEASRVRRVLRGDPKLYGNLG